MNEPTPPIAPPPRRMPPALLAALALAGCASLGPATTPAAPPAPAAQWQAPLPHDAQPTDLAALVAAVQRPAAGPADRRRRRPPARRSPRRARASSRRAPHAWPAAPRCGPTLDASASAIARPLRPGHAGGHQRRAPACRRAGRSTCSAPTAPAATPRRRGWTARRPAGTTRASRSPPRSAVELHRAARLRSAAGADRARRRARAPKPRA